MTGQSPSGRAPDLAEIAARLRAPPADLQRSPAAWRVARLAADAGLFLFDYEARVQLALPEAWLPLGRPDLGVTGEPPRWERGRFGESKYLAFRHDVLLGSLHAGHRAKWGAHELCHGLVGFAWCAEGSLLFHALAARVAEALPVALWYFFDEAGAARCERHRGMIELGPGYCERCEREAAQSDRRAEGEDSAWIDRGLAFLERELDGARRSLIEGRPVFTPHGAIDLMSDGLAYAAAHAPRLRSAEHERGIAHLFGGEGDGARGWFSALEPFIDHVARLGQVIAGRAPLAAGGPVYGEARLVAQDLGLRLVQIGADADGDCFAALMGIVAALGEREPAIAEAIDAYRALHEDYELPAPEEVFAVGYALPGDHGIGVAQLEAGLESALGATMAHLGETKTALIRRFAAAAEPSRAPLAERFAAFLARELGAEARETIGLATLEAAIASVPPPDPVELALGLDGAETETLRLMSGVVLVRPGFDAGGLLMHGRADPRGPRSFLVRRDAGDEVGLVALSERLAAELEAGPLDAAAVMARIDEDTELRAILEEGLLVPDRWSLEVS